MPGLVARLIADLHHYSIPVGGDDVDICLCFSALCTQAAFVKIWTSHVHNLPCHVKLQGGAGVRCVRFLVCRPYSLPFLLDDKSPCHCNGRAYVCTMASINNESCVTRHPARACARSETHTHATQQDNCRAATALSGRESEA